MACDDIVLRQHCFIPRLSHESTIGRTDESHWMPMNDGNNGAAGKSDARTNRRHRSELSSRHIGINTLRMDAVDSIILIPFAIIYSYIYIYTYKIMVRHNRDAVATNQPKVKTTDPDNKRAMLLVSPSSATISAKSTTIAQCEGLMPGISHTRIRWETLRRLKFYRRRFLGVFACFPSNYYNVVFHLYECVLNVLSRARQNLFLKEEEYGNERIVLSFVALMFYLRPCALYKTIVYGDDIHVISENCGEWREFVLARIVRAAW